MRDHPWIIAGSVVGAIVAVLKFIGGGSVIKGVVAVASISYSAVSGYQAYRQQKQAEKEFKKLQSQERSAFINYREATPSRRIIYGRTRVGGPLIFAHSPSKGKVHLVVALASHEIEEIESVWIGRDELTLDGSGNAGGKYAGVVKIHQYLGTSSQDVGADMITEGIGSPSGPILTTDKFKGIACLYVVLDDWAKKITGAEPEFSAIIKGKNDIDQEPTPATQDYTNNPVLCVRDYLVNYMGVPVDRVVVEQSEIDYCDENINLNGGGTETRYTLNGIIMSDQRHDEVLEDMANAFAGNIRYSGGKWRITTKPTDNTAFTIVDTEDLTQEYTFKFNRSDRELPNAIRSTYLDPDRNWQATQAPMLDLSGGNRRDELELELPFTHTHTAAQRISKIFLYRARAQASTRITCNPRAFKTLPGEVISFQADKLGFTQEMEVMEASLGYRVEKVDGREETKIEIALGLQEYDDTAYDWDETTEEQDLEEGEVDLGGVNTKVPTNVVGVETLVSSTPDFELDVDFDWNHPAITPEGTDLDDTSIEVVVEVTTNDGINHVNSYTKTKILDAELDDPGDAISHTISFDQNFEPSGSSYVSHDVVTKRIRTIFSDGTRSTWVDAADS